MTNEKKIWLIEQYAHKTWAVSLVLAQEAARAGEYGKGFAVVASEARRLAESMFEYAANARFEKNETSFKYILDIALQMKYLSINSDIESQGVATVSMDYNIPKSMAVFAENLRSISIKLNEIFDPGAIQKPYTLYELLSPSALSSEDSYFNFSISGFPLLENLKNIREVYFCDKKEPIGETYSLRGKKLPVINCYRKLNLPNPIRENDIQAIAIICLKGDRLNFDEAHAVLIDDLDVNAIVHSKAGVSVPAKKEHAFADYARDCWDLVCGDQIVFANWDKLL